MKKNSQSKKTPLLQMEVLDKVYTPIIKIDKLKFKFDILCEKAIGKKSDNNQTKYDNWKSNNTAIFGENISMLRRIIER